MPGSDLGDPDVFAESSRVLSAIRRAKTDAKQSQRAGVALVRVSGMPEVLTRLQQVERDLGAAGHVAQWEWIAVDEGGPSVEVAFQLNATS